jgi:hypothetical protein
LIPPRFILRVSVRVRGKEPISGLDTEPSITVGQQTVTVKQRWPFLIVEVRDFASEADAEAFLPHVKYGLWNIAIEKNIAFNAYFERRSITRPEDPNQAARNLAKSFGKPVIEPIDPVHGLTDEEGYTIFRSDENIRYLAMGQATGYVTTSWKNVSQVLKDGIENARSLKEKVDRITSVFDLYLANFYETSTRARLLTLISCLEVLAPKTERHPAAVMALSDFENQVKIRMSKATEEEEQFALETLLREIDFKKEKSIRRRVRCLVLSKAPLSEDDKISLAKKVVAAYDLRSTLVHDGVVDSEALGEAHETTLYAVKLLLSVRLRPAIQPPDVSAVAP